MIHFLLGRFFSTLLLGDGISHTNSLSILRFTLHKKWSPNKGYVENIAVDMGRFMVLYLEGSCGLEIWPSILVVCHLLQCSLSLSVYICILYYIYTHRSVCPSIVPPCCTPLLWQYRCLTCHDYDLCSTCHSQLLGGI